MSVPKVSVLIPCYNAAPYIGETLESVFRQTWSEIEVIVVDDGSTDRSADVIRSFSSPRLTLIEQDNRGQTSSLNVCLAYATGDFVQYLDADDLIDPTKIERQLARLLENVRCIASAEWGRFYDSPDEARFDPEPVWRDLDPLDWLALSRAEGLGMMLPALWLIPMRIIRASGPWAEKLTLNNDAEYFTRVLLTSERVLFCPGARCRYRSGLTGNLSGRKSQQAWESHFRVLQSQPSRSRTETRPRAACRFHPSGRRASLPHRLARARLARGPSPSSPVRPTLIAADDVILQEASCKMLDGPIPDAETVSEHCTCD
jgi:glycosyltransferase involved in cell wall biosynthesis